MRIFISSQTTKRNSALAAVLIALLASPAFAEMTAEEHYKRGMQENLDSKFAEAIADYDTAIKMQPDFWKAYANRASAEYYAKSYRAALNDLNLAMAHLPPMQSLTDLKNNIENAMKSESSGGGSGTKVRRNVTYNTFSTYNGGVPYTSKGQMAQLADIVMRGGHKIPSNLVHPQQNSLIHPMGSSTAAAASTTASTSTSTSTPTLSAKELLDRGTERAKANDLSGAIADFNEVIKLQPNNGLAWASRGSARIGAGDLQGAMTDLDKSIELMPNEPKLKELRDKLKSAMDQAHQNLNSAGH